MKKKTPAKRHETRNMVRLNFYLPQPDLDDLRRHAETAGLSVSEVMRQAISSYLEYEAA